MADNTATPTTTVERISTGVMRVVRGVVGRLPVTWKKALDDRLFGAIFQATRVTNDAYGWRPGDLPPAGGGPQPGKFSPNRDEAADRSRGPGDGPPTALPQIRPPP